MRQVSGEDCEIVGASRTDSGAHAKGQVCHFDTVRPIEPEKWVRALNKLLPSDLAVVGAARAPDRFHSRFCAEDRWYRYRIRTGPRDPLLGRWAHEFGKPLDVERMDRATEVLLGEHDFRSFTAELNPSVENTIRTLRKIELWPTGQGVRIDVVGTAFLRGMMRRIAGALLEVGAGKRPESDVRKLLDPTIRDAIHRPEVLPAQGLTLMGVRYGRPLRDHRDSVEEVTNDE